MSAATTAASSTVALPLDKDKGSHRGQEEEKTKLDESDRDRSSSSTLEKGTRVDAAVLPIDAAAERRLVRKLDLYIMPAFFYMYLLCFLDRTNIGNARVAGLERDLGLTGYMYNISLSVFYICYAAVEIPSNLILRRVGASLWIPIIIISFGLVSTCSAFIDNFADLIGVRIALGIAEGGLMPAFLVVLSRFYTKKELVFRTAFFASSAVAAGMFGGLLAYGFLQVNVSIVPGWRAIFFFEGIITLGTGLLAFFWVFDSPAKAKFLTAEEKVLAETRVRRENIGSRVLIEATKTRLVLRAFKNINTFACALGFGLASLSLQSFSLFVPSIIRGINPAYTTLETQIKTVPVYAVAWVIAIVFSYIGAKYDRRAYTIISVQCFAVVGLVMLLATPTSAHNTRYAAVFLCAMGFFTSGVIWLSWAVNNSGLDQHKAVAAAMVIGLGTLGSIVASWAYLPFDAPRYTIGNSLNLGAILGGQLLALGLMLFNRRENRLRDFGGRDYRLEGKTQDEIFELGNRHPDFRYVW